MKWFKELDQNVANDNESNSFVRKGCFLYCRLSPDPTPFHKILRKKIGGRWLL